MVASSRDQRHAEQLAIAEKAGIPVRAKWTDGRYYPADILSVNTRNLQVKVKWHDPANSSPTFTAKVADVFVRKGSNGPTKGPAKDLRSI